MNTAPDEYAKSSIIMFIVVFQPTHFTFKTGRLSAPPK